MTNLLSRTALVKTFQPALHDRAEWTKARISTQSSEHVTQALPFRLLIVRLIQDTLLYYNYCRKVKDLSIISHRHLPPCT